MRWCYRLMTEEFGPVTDDQIHERLQSGILKFCDEICAENSDQWRRGVDVPEFEGFQKNLSVAESLDDLAFEFEEVKSSADEVAPPSSADEQATSMLHNDAANFDSSTLSANAEFSVENSAALSVPLNINQPDQSTCDSTAGHRARLLDSR